MGMRGGGRTASPKRSSLQRCRPSNEFSVENHQPAAKRIKLVHPAFPPPRFWDNLSQQVLTKNALRELDRRNTAEPPSQPHSRSRRPHTRRQRAAAAQRQTYLSAQEFLQQSSPSDQAQLQRFARHGGPDLRDLTGYRQSSNVHMSSSRPSLGRRKRGSQSADEPGAVTKTTKTTRSTVTTKSTKSTKTTTTKSTGPYDRAFLQHLVDNRIFPHGFDGPDGRRLPEPENIDEIRRALKRPRASLSPSRFTQEDFEEFERKNVHATKESLVNADVIPIIRGERGDVTYIGGDTVFTNLDHLTDGSLVRAKPDLYYGAQPQDVHEDIRQALDNLIVPSTQGDLPIVPNNFVEVKGPDGSLSVALRQMLYVGALGSRGIHSLQSYSDSSDSCPCYDNKAYVLTWTYLMGFLSAYTNHPIQPPTPGARPTYVMKQVGHWALTVNLESFRQGVTAFRNGRDWAKLQRDTVIALANEKAASTKLHGSDTSTDELALDQPSAKRVSTSESTRGRRGRGRGRGRGRKDGDTT